MKVNLFISYYIERNVVRQKELSNALLFNVQNKFIDNVFLVSEHIVKYVKGGKIIKYPVKNRPSYNDFFKLTEQYPDDINIIANSDIYFDEKGIELLIKYSWKEKEIFALTRWESPVKFYGYDFSQDCWIKKGKIDKIEGGIINLGVPGCDGKIAYLLSEAGYEVRNPSLSIKAYHNHKSEIRNYIVSNIVKNVIPKPYKAIKPTIL